MNRITKLESFKFNALSLARHHRQHCDGADCNIQLSLLADMLKMLGVKLTNEERREFI